MTAQDWLLVSFLIVCSGIVDISVKGQTGILNQGDVMVGGLFPVHFSSTNLSSSLFEVDPGECTIFNDVGYFLAEAMVYAVETINEHGHLPFNLTLGYDIQDTCNKVSNAMKATLKFVQTRKRPQDRVGGSRSHGTHSEASGKLLNHSSHWKHTKSTLGN